VTPLQIGLGVLVGFAAGILSGLFGVGGGIVTTPAVNTLLGGTAIQAIATPLPVILPTSLVGSYTYAKAGEVSFRAARWAAVPGIGGAVAGALLTEVVNVHLLLLVTAGVIAFTAVQVIAGCLDALGRGDPAGSTGRSASRRVRISGVGGGS
jgi:uncharacterized membrane protein YfcA